MDKRKKSRLNIAVTGVSGTGKSSFINAIRGLDADSEGASEVGVMETTRKPAGYELSSNTNALFWDLPGCGTPNFPQATYLDQVGFEKYDLFILLYCDRFTENDLWLATQIRKRKKRFYLARTKIDKAIEDDKHDYPERHKEQAVLEKARKHCRHILEQNGFVDTDVFLISSRWPHRWDFPKLEAKLIADIWK